jgi:hypothetical protein
LAAARPAGGGLVKAVGVAWSAPDGDDC